MKITDKTPENKATIYRLIKNDETIYVGSSTMKYISSVICRHRTDMTKYSYNTNKTTGKDFDSYEIIELVDIENRFKTERKWIQYYKTKDNGLNTSYPFDDDEFISLYNQGLNDYELASILKVNQSNTNHRRNKLGLPPIRKHHRANKEEDIA